GRPGLDVARRYRERAARVRERMRGQPDREPDLPGEDPEDPLLRSERVPLDRLHEPVRRGVLARSRCRGRVRLARLDAPHPAALQPGPGCRSARVGASPLSRAARRSSQIVVGIRNCARGAARGGVDRPADDAARPARRSGLTFPKLIVSAGDPSGDRLGAACLHALRARGVTVDAAGLGGPALRGAGLETVASMESVAVMGFADVVRHLPAIRRARAALLDLLAGRPDAIFLPIDSPGLNLGLARHAHRAGHPVVYYVCPQIWAWNYGRVSRLREDVDLTLLLFRFEEPILHKERVPARWVGHPAGALAADPARRDLARRAFEIAPDQRLIALLPGSRRAEVRRHLAPMLDAASRLVNHAGPGIQVVVSDAGPVDEVLAAGGAADTLWRALQPIHHRGEAQPVLRAADLAIVASGTATLETAALGVPMVIVYRTSALNFAIARRVVRLPRIGLANIVAGQDAAPELIQDPAHAAAPAPPAPPPPH